MIMPFWLNFNLRVTDHNRAQTIKLYLQDQIDCLGLMERQA